MAVIQKIRERYAKWAGGLIALSLVGFILQDALSGESNLSKIFGNDATSVAKVNGDKVEGKDFYEAVGEYQSLTELYRKGQPVTEEEQANMKQGVLDQIIMEKMVEKEAEKLGLTVSEAEKKEMFYGPNFDPTVQQFPYFAGQNGQFDPQAPKNFEREVKKNASDENAARANQQWLALQRFLVRQKLVQKYNALIGNSAYTPKYVIERNQKDATMQAGVRFVKIPYATIDDATIKVSEEEIKAYMNKHQSMFESLVPTRTIDYVVYDIVPNAEDTAKAITSLNKIKDKLAASTDEARIVNSNSDKAYTDAYVTKKDYQSQYADTIFNMAEGSVFGPYLENETYKLTKVVAKKTLPDSVKSRHILIKTEDQGKPMLDSAIAKARIDSIAGAIAAGADFNEMVVKYSDDQGSKDKSGVYDFPLSQRAGISKEFGDFIFEGKTGERKTVKVGNQQYAGYHYIEIMEQKAPVLAVKLAEVDKGLITSSKASNAINASAVKFSGMNNNAKAFDEAVKKEGLNVRVAEDVKPGDFVIPGLGASRDLVMWAYKAKVGDVSDPIQLGKKYIVAKLSAAQESGMKSITPAIRAQVESAVRMEKKGVEIANKYKSMQLDQIAQATGQMVQTADSIKGNTSQQAMIGYEPKVLGYIFNPKIQPNTMSPALKGREGVYFVTLTHRETVAASPTDMMMMEQQMSMEAQQAKGYMGSMLPEVFKRTGEVKYNAKNIQ